MSLCWTFSILLLENAFFDEIKNKSCGLFLDTFSYFSQKRRNLIRRVNSLCRQVLVRICQIENDCIASSLICYNFRVTQKCIKLMWNSLRKRFGPSFHLKQLNSIWSQTYFFFAWTNRSAERDLRHLLLIWIWCNNRKTNLANVEMSKYWRTSIHEFEK